MQHENPLPHICIVGAGAVGLGLAANLQARMRVTVLCRSNKAQQLRHGASTANLGYVTSAADLSGEISSIWLCVKAHDNPEALRAIEPLLGAHRPVILLSNGLGVFDECVRIVSDRAPVIRGLLLTGFLETLDSVIQSGPLVVSLAARPQEAQALQYVQSLLEGIGARVTLEKDIATAEWKKVLVSAAVNPVCSIVGGPNSALLDLPDLTALATEVLNEVRAVAAAENIDVSTVSDQAIFDATKSVGANYNSHLVDLHRGRKTEIEYVLGAILRIAQNRSISVPRTLTLYRLCKALEAIKTLSQTAAATQAPAPR